MINLFRRAAFLSLATLALSMTAGGQTGANLRIDHLEENFFSEEMLTFQLETPGSNEVWLLQSSENARDWEDLVFLNEGGPTSGYGVSFAMAAFSGEGSGKTFFRAAKRPSEDPTYRDCLAGQLRWREQGYDDYSFVITSSQGMVQYEARYTVVDGAVSEVQTLSIWPPEFEPPANLTIDDLFARVKSARDQNAVQVDVDWNRTNGYPETGFIDISRELADEEQNWAVLEFIPTSPESQEFLAARDQWREAGIARYSYVVETGSRLGGYEVRYTVEDGEVTNVEVLVEPPSFVTVPGDVTMDHWFAVVADAFEVGADEVAILWNDVYGYPEVASIDYDLRIADEERYWRIKELVVLE